MHATTVAVDLAKSVFQIAVADEHWHIVETQRLTRTQFERWFANRAVGLVVMEACGSAHHWARWLNSLGIEVRLLPAQYVRAYVRRNKTDATDAAALLEAARASDLRPVQLGIEPVLGPHLQEGRPLSAHAAHARRAQRTQGGASGSKRGQAGAGRALLGATGARA